MNQRDLAKKEVLNTELAKEDRRLRTLEELDRRLAEIKRRQGPVPQLPEDVFETVFRNDLRMYKSKN